MALPAGPLLRVQRHARDVHLRDVTGVVVARKHNVSMRAGPESKVEVAGGMHVLTGLRGTLGAGAGGVAYSLRLIGTASAAA